MGQVKLLLLMLTISSLFGVTISSTYLSIKGKDFYYGNSKIFLSGVNIAWNSYAYDFGNGQYAKTGPVLEKWIKEIADSGGNSLRIWIHCEGQNTPKLNEKGFAIAPDLQGTLISDISAFLDIAASKNILVTLVLWNGAVRIDKEYKELLNNDDKLQAYIKKVLEPLVNGLKNKSALAAWEIMNEPEGSVQIAKDDNPCYDTTKMRPFGAGWSKSNISMERILRFINKNAAAIKNLDPKALVTIGSWSEIPQTDAFDDSYNYYKDSCLIGAGGEIKGTIDFHQLHTYSWKGHWSQNSPFVVSADAYKLDKPVIIGEFSSSCSAEKGANAVNTLWDYAFKNGYKGIWSWQYNAGGDCSDNQALQKQGMKRIRNYKDNNGMIIAVKIK